MPKLFVIFASAAPTAIIIRRGPSKWAHLIQWNLRNDSFVHGAWFKGRTYEKKCDLSPNGQLFLYFAFQGSRLGTDFKDSWTAVSRTPWLSALTVWPQGMTYGGGGRFIDDTRVSVRAYKAPLSDFPLVGLTSVGGDCPTHQSTGEVPDADWCGRDPHDQIVFSRGGQLFRIVRKKEKLIADFTDLKPDPQPAPEWASRPLPQPKSPPKKASRRKRKP